jgi:hypothetical protein
MPHGQKPLLDDATLLIFSAAGSGGSNNGKSDIAKVPTSPRSKKTKMITSKNFNLDIY